MKPFLVNVPVAIDAFVRPEVLKKTFSAIKEARPSKLFIISDGPRKGISGDIENIKESRRIVEDIDWDCEVDKIYFDSNQGMYTKGKIAREIIFSRVDRCIFLEDDLLVSVSFFRFCADLLEKYKDDLRIHFITGMNYLGNYSDPTSDYFFCAEGSIWGFATWKRTYIQFNNNYKNDEYVLRLIKKLADKDKKRYSKIIDGYAKNEYYNGHIAGIEYYKNLLKYSQNQLFIVPKKNMVNCLGYTKGSTHGSDSLRKMPRALRRLYDMETFEYQFPLRHPSYIVRDIDYEDKVNKIMAWNSNLIKNTRRIESLIYHLYYGDYSRIIKKIKGMLRKEIEN